MIDFVLIPEERIKILKSDKKLKQLREFSDVKISFKEGIELEGEDPLMIFRVKEVVRAFGRGFDLEDAMDLLDEYYILENISINDFVGKSKNRQTVLKGRVIGKEGSVKERIEKLTETKISVYGKNISIIGKQQNLQIAHETIEMLLRGAMHSTVYRFLESKQK